MSECLLAGTVRKRVIFDQQKRANTVPHTLFDCETSLLLRRLICLNVCKHTLKPCFLCLSNTYAAVTPFKCLAPFLLYRSILFIDPDYTSGVHDCCFVQFCLNKLQYRFTQIPLFSLTHLSFTSSNIIRLFINLFVCLFIYFFLSLFVC